MSAETETTAADFSEKIDVGINIFAKPFQTALSLLSLIKMSGAHIGRFWLQYEPVGSKFDSIDPYAIARYVSAQGFDCQLSQPERWLDLEAADEEMLKEYAARSCIRYEHAFEHSFSRLLFLMHNDIFVLRDVLGPLKAGLGGAFAIGQLGQCWNCPAANAELMASVLGAPPCRADNYEAARPTHEQLCQLYSEARAKNIFVRPYDTEGFKGEFEKQPWPLPECRINEWACLLNLELTRPKTIPHGQGWPPGAYRVCGSHNLDIGTPFFRDMHARGLYAKNFDLSTYIRHWVGTGNNTPLKYAQSEDRARRLLERHFPAYIAWLEGNGEKV